MPNPGLMILLGAKPEGAEAYEEKDGCDEALLSCAEDLIDAIHSKDPKAVAEELQYIFEILESEPHEEGPHDEDANDEHEE